MAKNSFNRIQSAPMRRRPMNPLVPLAIVVLVIVGLLFFFANNAELRPVQPIEVDVARATDAR